MQQIASTNDSLILKKYLNYADKLNEFEDQKGIIYQAIAIRSEQLHFSYCTGNVCLSLSTLYLHRGEYRESLSASLIALTNFKEINDSINSGISYYKIAASNYYLNRRDSATIYAIKSIDLIGDHPCRELAATYNFLGKMVFISRSDINGCLYYHLKGYNISKQLKDTLGIIFGGACLADDYIVMKEFGKANTYNIDNIKLAIASGDVRSLGQAYNYACYMYSILNKPDSSIWAGKLALQYSIETDINLFSHATLNLEHTYNLINNQEARLRVIKACLNKLYKLKNLPTDINVFYEDYADVDYKLGNYKEAYEYYKKYSDHKDSLDLLLTNSLVEDLNVKYQTVQKEKTLSDQRLQLAKKDLLLQRNRSYVYLSLTGLVLTLLIAGLLYLRYIYNKKVHLRQLQAIKQEKEIQLLEALIQGEEKERTHIAKELHDGVAGMLVAAKLHLNALVDQNNTIAQSKDLERVVNLLDETYTEVRKTSHNLMPEVLLNHGLEGALRRYCDNISSSRKLLIQYDSWGDFERYKNSFELSIYRIVQELISNIIKHSKATKALVQISLHDNLLSIAIEDNGVGFSEENYSDGMGLHNLQSKVLALDGNLEIISNKGKGVRAYMEFDVSHNKTSLINPLNN